MTLQQQYPAENRVTDTNTADYGDTESGNPERADQSGAAAGIKRQFKRLEAEQESYRKKERDLEIRSQELSNGLQSVSDEDARLRWIEKTAGYTALPSPFLIGLGAVTHSPVIAMLGAIMLIFALALKFYSKIRIERIGKILLSMQAEYRQSSEELNSIRILNEKLMRELRRLKERCAAMK